MIKVRQLETKTKYKKVIILKVNHHIMVIFTSGILLWQIIQWRLFNCYQKSLLKPIRCPTTASHQPRHQFFPFHQMRVPTQCPSKFINGKTWGTIWPYAPLQRLNRLNKIKKPSTRSISIQSKNHFQEAEGISLSFKMNKQKETLPKATHQCDLHGHVL